MKEKLKKVLGVLYKLLVVLLLVGIIFIQLVTIAVVSEEEDGFIDMRVKPVEGEEYFI